MNHYWLVWLVVLADIFKLETSGQIEVKLHRRQLPGAPDGVFDANIYLWTIENSFTFNALVGNATIIQRRGQHFFRAIPIFVRTEVMNVAATSAYRKFHFDFLKTKDLKHVECKVDTTDDLTIDCLGRTENMRIVLRKPAHARQTMQCPRQFRAIDSAQLGIAN